MKMKLTNDMLFKRVFASSGYEEITLDFLEAILGERYTEIVFENPYHYNLFANIGKMDYTEVDILVRDRNNLYVTIEMQVLPHVGFLERILYYASSAYRRNYGRKDIAEETVEEQEGLKFA